MSKVKSSVVLMFAALFFSIAGFSGCAVEASKKNSVEQKTNSEKTAVEAENLTKNSDAPKKIEIKPNSPSETVNAFFSDLREKRFREAIYLTNLRPAIEGLTEAEMNDFQVDFESLAQTVSDKITINGEVISGDSATVMAKIPDPATGKIELQTFRLKKQNDYWTILTVDEAAEKKIQKDGKNYFFNLRLETHEQEAKKMIDKISQAQMVYAIQNQGVFADLTTLAAQGLVPEDVRAADSTGYIYSVAVSEDRKNYTAAAVPKEYGKTGKLSYLFEVTEKGKPVMTEKDNGGKLLSGSR